MNAHKIMKTTLEHLELYAGDVYIRRLCRDTLKLVADVERKSQEWRAANPPPALVGFRLEDVCGPIVSSGGIPIPDGMGG